MFDDAEAFLIAIRDNLKNRLPQMIYADWLDERGDERAPWFRDPELFDMMGPSLETPIPELMQRLVRLPEIEESELFEYVDQLTQQFQRAGPLVVPALLERLEHEYDWRHILLDLLKLFPRGLANHYDTLIQRVNSGNLSAEEGFGLLIRAGECRPDAVQFLMKTALIANDYRAESATRALREADYFAIRVIAAEWLEETVAELEEPVPDDQRGLTTKLAILGHLSRKSPELTPVVVQALTYPNRSIAQAVADSFTVNDRGNHDTELLRKCTSENAPWQ